MFSGTAQLPRSAPVSTTGVASRAAGIVGFTIGIGGDDAAAEPNAGANSASAPTVAATRGPTTPIALAPMPVLDPTHLGVAGLAMRRLRQRSFGRKTVTAHKSGVAWR